jgi:acyl-CoA dehydrogenase
MDFDYSAKTKELQAQAAEVHGRPCLSEREDLQAAARGQHGRRQALDAAAGHRGAEEEGPAAGLWNLFLPVDSASASGYEGAGLTNQEYAPLAEIMGRVPWASEVFNCSAPDTGNMETIARYGSDEIKARWLKPLLEGEIRSAFAMTEPDVASSDATNISTRIERQGDEYVINGHKWWISGAADPRCKVFITMGKTDPEAPRHSQQSMIIVPATRPASASCGR